MSAKSHFRQMVWKHSNIQYRCMDKLSPFKPSCDMVTCISEPVVGETVLFLVTEAVASLSAEQYDAVLSQTSLLLDFLWEKLNTGNWKEVDVAWRHCYSLVSLCRALALVQSGEVDPMSLAPAIQACDMGLLMGAPLGDNVLARLAGYLHGYMSNGSDNCAGVHDSCALATRISEAVNDSEQQSNKRRRLSYDERSPIARVFPEGHTVARVSLPAMLEFKCQYLDPQVPVIITDAMQAWPALHKWSVDYIAQIAGYRTVPVEVGSKYTEDAWGQKLTTLNDFIATYMGESNINGNGTGYVAQHQLFDQILELGDDIMEPDYCALGTDCDSVDVNAWFGPAGTVSPLHHDPKDNFLAQVFGSKFVRLYSPADNDYLYPFTEASLMTNTSQVDVESPDLERFPKFVNARPHDCVLGKGELLFIPKRWWHHIRSLERSFSVSFWF